MFRIAHRVSHELDIAVAFRDLANVALMPLSPSGYPCAKAADADVLIVGGDRYDREAVALLRSATRRPRWIQLTSTGVDSVRALGLPEGAVLTNAGSVWATTVADHALALMLGLIRGVPACERHRAGRRWARSEIAAGLSALEDATVLCVGFGGIGREVAIRARAFGARVIAATRSGKASAEADSAVALSGLHAALHEADIVVIAMALAETTRHLIDAAALACMKRTALLVNVARGPIVDEAALIAALADKRIAGAGLDVFDVEPLPASSPLWGFDNVILTPHLGGYGGRQTRERLAQLCRDNVDRFRAGQPLKNLIDTAGYPRW